MGESGVAFISRTMVKGPSSLPLTPILTLLSRNREQPTKIQSRPLFCSNNFERYMAPCSIFWRTGLALVRFLWYFFPSQYVYRDRSVIHLVLTRASMTACSSELCPNKNAYSPPQTVEKVPNLGSSFYFMLVTLFLLSLKGLYIEKGE